MKKLTFFFILCSSLLAVWGGLSHSCLPLLLFLLLAVFYLLGLGINKASEKELKESAHQFLLELDKEDPMWTEDDDRIEDILIKFHKQQL